MKIFLIAGTGDGRKLAEFLSRHGHLVTASVVSEYGKKILEQYEKILISDKKLDEDELTENLRGNFEILVDASHPYAVNVSQNAIAACRRAGNFFNRLKNFVPVLVPLFLSSFRRADELAMAMEARCYKGGEGRAHFRQLKFQRLDFLVALMIAIILICAVLLSML